jgi:hypothetical protein
MRLSDKSDYMLIFTGELALPSPGVRRRLDDKLKSVVAKASEVTVITLQENMRRFLSSLDTILRNSPKDVGGLTLDEIEIYAQVDGKGNIGIAGIAGAEVAVQGGIKFVLRKRI